MEADIYNASQQVEAFGIYHKKIRQGLKTYFNFNSFEHNRKFCSEFCTKKL